MPNDYFKRVNCSGAVLPGTAPFLAAIDIIMYVLILLDWKPRMPEQTRRPCRNDARSDPQPQGKITETRIMEKPQESRLPMPVLVRVPHLIVGPHAANRGLLLSGLELML